MIADFRAEAEKQLRQASGLYERMADSLPDKIAAAAELIISAYKNSNKVMLCGNGGSAADCQHLAAELVGRYKRDRRGLAAVALTTDSSILTAVGNDFGFEDVFRRQVEALGRKGDVLIGVSTSGNSPNVTAALKEAGQAGIKRIVLIGNSDCRMASLADVVISVPCGDTPRIQEVHAAAGHIICDLVERAMTS